MPDGDAGEVWLDIPTVFRDGERHLFLARLNSDGSTDASFNPILTFDGSSGGYMNSMALQSDGKIIIGGTFQTVNGIARVNYARLNSDGSLDNNFIIPFEQSYAPSILGILLQPDGKILIGGDFRFTGSSSTVSVAQLNTNGDLYTPFTLASNTTTTPSAIRAFARQTDGKILLGGTWNYLNRPLLSRLNADGSPDTTFKPGKIGIGFDSDSIYSIIVQPNGKILIAGSFTNINNNPRSNIARLIENGGLDFSFNNIQPGAVNSLNRDSDGSLIIAGNFDRIGNSSLSGLARLQVSDVIRMPSSDLDGDGRTDLSIFRPSVGEWWYLRSSDGGNKTFQFGNSSDKLVPCDYTGDGKTDIAFFRPSTGQWFILRSENGSFYSFPFGINGDIPVPGDYDGDGKTDAAVFRPSTLTWYISRSSGETTIQQFGATGDVPVVADYDGDGKTDIAIYRPSKGEWWINRSSLGSLAFQFGTSTDKPVQGDYTGDGRTDVAFFRPSTNEWFVLRSENGSFYSFPFGAAGDVASPGDYDGDGKTDATVFRPSTNTWFAQRSSSGTMIQTFGQNGDVSVPNAFVP